MTGKRQEREEMFLPFILYGKREKLPLCITSLRVILGNEFQILPRIPSEEYIPGKELMSDRWVRFTKNRESVVFSL